MSRCPSLELAFVKLDHPDPNRLALNKASDTMSVPVYHSPTREQHLVDVDVPIAKSDEKDTWILAGVALLLAGE